MIYSLSYWSWYQYINKPQVKNATIDVVPTKDDWLVVFQPYDYDRRLLVSNILENFDYSKRVLIHYEGRYRQPHGFKLRYQQKFGRIYTYNSTDVDGDTVKYMPIPVWITENECYPIGNRTKNFCSVVTNYGQKGEPKGIITQNFKKLGMEVYGIHDKHIPEDITNKPLNNNTDTKYIPKYSSKVKMLSDYLFVLAIESQLDLGHVTEKLFDVIAAGAIPIYLGPIDISDFIPESCYINYRDFWSEVDLFNYIKYMPQQKIKEYQSSIIRYQKELVGMRTYESCMRFLCKDLGFDCEAPYYNHILELTNKIISRTKE